MATSSSAPWVEKYRPKSLDEIAHQEEALGTIRATLAQRCGSELPHLLMHGPPGTGKTTTALALARTLYGDDHMKHYVKELNASDDRGIAAVREKVKLFASQAVSGAALAGGGGRPQFKLIILDEADSMTREAQACLRRIMEHFVETTRFVICCNYVTRMIDPIVSRCLRFFFRPVGEAAHAGVLRRICGAESVALEAGAEQLLFRASRGDLRRSIGLLQMAAVSCATAASSSSSPSSSTTVTAAQVEQVAQQVPQATMQAVWQCLASGSLSAAGALGEDLANEGFPGTQLTSQLLTDLRTGQSGMGSTISDLQKARCAMELARQDEMYARGGSEALQMPALLMELRTICHQ